MTPQTRSQPRALKRRTPDADLPAEARERLSAIRRHDELRAAGCAEQAALRVIGVSRRTMYRWKAALAASGQRGLAPKSTRPRRVRRRSCKPSDVKAVLDLRRKHPFMGKAPIQRMLERKGLRLSVSTVGRILSRAIAAGAVPLASVCEGRVKPRRRRRFDGWANKYMIFKVLYSAERSALIPFHIPRYGRARGCRKCPRRCCAVLMCV